MDVRAKLIKFNIVRLSKIHLLKLIKLAWLTIKSGILSCHSLVMSAMGAVKIWAWHVLWLWQCWMPLQTWSHNTVEEARVTRPFLFLPFSDQNNNNLLGNGGVPAMLWRGDSPPHFITCASLFLPFLTLFSLAETCLLPSLQKELLFLTNFELQHTLSFSF